MKNLTKNQKIATGVGALVITAIIIIAVAKKSNKQQANQFYATGGVKPTREAAQSGTKNPAFVDLKI